MCLLCESPKDLPQLRCMYTAQMPKNFLSQFMGYVLKADVHEWSNNAVMPHTSDSGVASNKVERNLPLVSLLRRNIFIRAKSLWSRPSSRY